MGGDLLFEWDQANVGHHARHGISPAQAEQAVLDPAAVVLEIQAGAEERVKLVGMEAGGLIIVVIFTFRGDAVRPITAYNATLRMQKIYLEQERI